MYFPTRGVRPFFSKKYDITKHPSYKYLADADKKNAFPMEKYMQKKKSPIKMSDIVDIYEVGVI